MVWTIYQLKKTQHWPHTTTHSMTSSYLMALNLEQTDRARQEGVRLMRAAQTWKCWCKQTLIAGTLEIRQRQDTEEANIGDLRKMINDPSSDPDKDNTHHCRSEKHQWALFGDQDIKANKERGIFVKVIEPTILSRHCFAQNEKNLIWLLLFCP